MLSLHSISQTWLSAEALLVSPTRSPAIIGKKYYYEATYIRTHINHFPLLPHGSLSKRPILTLITSKHPVFPDSFHSTHIMISSIITFNHFFIGIYFYSFFLIFEFIWKNELIHTCSSLSLRYIFFLFHLILPYEPKLDQKDVKT